MKFIATVLPNPSPFRGYEWIVRLKEDNEGYNTLRIPIIYIKEEKDLYKFITKYYMIDKKEIELEIWTTREEDKYLIKPMVDKGDDK